MGMRSPLTFTLLGGEIEKVGGPATQKSLLSPCPCTESIRADPLTFTLLGGEIEKVGGSATHKELTCGLWSLEDRHKAQGIHFRFCSVGQGRKMGHAYTGRYKNGACIPNGMMVMSRVVAHAHPSHWANSFGMHAPYFYLRVQLDRM